MKIDKTFQWKGHLIGFYLYIGKSGIMLEIDIDDYTFSFNLMIMKIKSPEPEIDETYEALKQFKIIEWIRSKVNYLRTLGINTNYPFGCKTFKDFLRELKKHKYKTAKHTRKR